MSILSDRYASAEMRELWSPENKICAERRLWILVMRAQSEALRIPASAIADYERVLNEVDLESIAEREFKNRHDVKARIEEFNSLAGHQYIHLGMTSRDVTENVEIWQVKEALLLIQMKSAALLYGLSERATEFRSLPIVARSHNVPAQITTLGKKFATIATESLFAFERLANLLERLPIRGVRGPVGTAQDISELIDSKKLDSALATELGFAETLSSTGQIYPRSIDFEVVSTLVQLAAAPSNLALAIRLMAGNELVSEGFQPGQVGSSAMPHKMNSRSCERINGLTVVLRGYLTMVAELAGGQWNEGDVSDSVVRRVVLSDSFFAMDAILETTLTVLREFGIFQSRISAEIETNLPYLATTRILLAAVKAGADRESAHSALTEITTAALKRARSGEQVSVSDLIAADPRVPLDANDLLGILGEPLNFVGEATDQVDLVVAQIKEVIETFPAAMTFQPSPIR